MIIELLYDNMICLLEYFVSKTIKEVKKMHKNIQTDIIKANCWKNKDDTKQTNSSSRSGFVATWYAHKRYT